MMPPAAYSRSQRRPHPRERARRRTLRRALPAMPVSRHECPFPSLARNAGPPRLFSLREQEPGPALVSLLLRTTTSSGHGSTGAIAIVSKQQGGHAGPGPLGQTLEMGVSSPFGGESGGFRALSPDLIAA